MKSAPIFLLSLIFFLISFNDSNAQLNINAGPDTILCESNFETYQLGDVVSIDGEFPPYSYSWSCEYTNQVGTYYATTFINDTAISHPTFISAFDTLTFTLEITDNNGNEATDDVEVILSHFLVCLADCVESINEGDSVKLGHCISGGVPPYIVSWDNEETLSDPLISSPWAKPNSTTEYTMVLTDAAGCMASSSSNI